MGLYASKTKIAKLFEITTPTVYERIKGIRKEIASGRYTRYAISDRLINKAVFLDYNTYHKELEDKIARKYVADFDIEEAIRYLGEFEKKKTVEQEDKTA